MKSSIEVNKKEESSFWKEVAPCDRYTMSALPIEETDIKLLTDAILAEFHQTNDELKPLMHERILRWLSEMSDEDLENLENEKVRDFIYEMF